MKTINSISLVRLKNEVHAQFHEVVKSLMLEVGTEDTSYEFYYPPYKKALDNELEALLIITKSRKTVDIFDQDDDRDQIFRGFSDTVKGLTNHYDPTYRKAANVLWDLLQHFGNVAKKTFDAETAAINDLIREFQDPEVESAAETVRVRDWIEQLKHSNLKFHRLMMERYCEVTAKTTYRMKTARVETDKFYRAIVENVNHQVLLGEVTPKLQHFITELNGIVTRFKSKLAQEAGRKKTEEDSD